LAFFDAAAGAPVAPFFAPGTRVFPSLPTVFIIGFTAAVFAAIGFPNGLPAAAFTGAALARAGFAAGLPRDFATTLGAGFAVLWPGLAGFAAGREGSRFFELAGALRAAAFAAGRTRDFAGFDFARAPDLREVAMGHPS
jgi:hypothetical protein